MFSLAFPRAAVWWASSSFSVLRQRCTQMADVFIQIWHFAVTWQAWKWKEKWSFALNFNFKMESEDILLFPFCNKRHVWKEKDGCMMTIPLSFIGIWLLSDQQGCFPLHYWGQVAWSLTRMSLTVSLGSSTWLLFSSVKRGPKPTEGHLNQYIFVTQIVSITFLTSDKTYHTRTKN